MQLDKHWLRFIENFVFDFNPKFPKRFIAEFGKNGKLYRVKLVIEEQCS